MSNNNNPNNHPDNPKNDDTATMNYVKVFLDALSLKSKAALCIALAKDLAEHHGFYQVASYQTTLHQIANLYHYDPNTIALNALEIDWVAKGNAIEAIRSIRNRLKIGLREAKMLVDNFRGMKI